MLDGQAVQASELVFGRLLGQDNLIVSNAKPLPAQGVFDQFAQLGPFLW